MTSIPAYLRFPSINGDRVVFVTEDDLWSVSADGGAAQRLTSDLLEIGRPSLSPDGSLLAFTSVAQGQPDVYVMPATGGPARRLTWLGEASVAGWAPDGRVVVTSAAGQPFRPLTLAYLLAPEPVPGGGLEPLPLGPVSAVAYGPGGAVAIGRNTADPARWKRYRGGTAGTIWVDPGGAGDFRPMLDAGAADGNLASPMWVGERVFFLSDHEGIGNLYSCLPDGSGLRRHTDHDEHYARWASTDGTRIVYQAGAQLWLYDPRGGAASRIGVEVGSPRTQRQPRFIEASKHLSHYALDADGERLALDVRGKLVTLSNWDRAVRQHGRPQGVRYRLARFLGKGGSVVVVSDEGGEEGLEVHAVGPATPEAAGTDGAGTDRAGTDGAGTDGAGTEVVEPAVRRLAVPGLGRVVELVPSPDGERVAVVNHQNQLLVATVAGGGAAVVDESRFGRPGEPAWSPDSRWLAYSFPGSEHTRCIKVAEAAGGAVHAVTPPQFRDTCPSFDPGGRWLSFLSRRTFDPVYDSLVFDMGFPRGARPYLVTLRAEDPSPFLVRPKPPEDGEEKAPESGGDGSKGDGDHAPPPVRIDWDGIEGRVLAFPVPEGRYDKVAAIRGKVLLLAHPVEGALGGDIFSTAPPATASLDAYDLAGGKHETLVHDISGFEVSAGGEKVVYAAGSGGGGGGGGGRRLRVVAAGKKPDPEVEHEPPGRASGWVDLGRVRIGVEPAAEWAQMVREAWRLQAEQFWVQDMSGVDWDRVLARYLPLVDLVATRAEFSDLMWEMQGELGTSHCYEIGGDYRHPPEWGLARLGADLAWDADTSRWRVSRVAAGASWDQKEASPLASPGVGVGPGTAILAVNGQAVDALTGPGPLLSNQAGQPVELTVEGSGDHQARQVLVPTLSDERPLRYREWVEANRAWVRRATDGRVGYLHVPDMMAPGFAEFHRSFLSEVERDALVVDARFNNGGHVSGLLLEKLARRRIGYDVSRWGPVEPYPQESVGGPIVLVTNEWAGSDGDIFTHGFKLLGLGPVVGTRTWGGVIGIELSLPLVDGSVTTQPEYAFWFVDVGWGVENHGSDPDHEVVLRPQDYAAGRDAQLERAVELVSDALAGHRPPRPDYDSRARLVLPSLPARV